MVNEQSRERLEEYWWSAYTQYLCLDNKDSWGDYLSATKILNEMQDLKKQMEALEKRLGYCPNKRTE